VQAAARKKHRVIRVRTSAKTVRLITMHAGQCAKAGAAGLFMTIP